MLGLYREERVVINEPLARDIARHLYTRINCGKVAIVTEEPIVMLANLRKQWVRLQRQVARERSSTLDATRILELTNALARMLSMRFTVRPPIDEPQADVLIATVDQFLQWAPVCRTMYATCPIEKEKLYMITAWMTRRSLVVMYKKQP